MPKPTKSGRPAAKPTITDPRFAGIASDARFRLPSKTQSRVQLDDRFSKLLKDDDFTKKAKVDRYGRKIKSTEGKKELQRMFQLEQADKDEDEDDDEETVSDEDSELHSDTEEQGSSDEDEEESSDAESVTGAIHKQPGEAGPKYDPARDGGFSSSEDDSDEEFGEEEEEDDVDAVLGEDIEEGEVTSRIAIVNLDWDFIRSVDIMAVASSFAPQGGRVLRVTIYPSEFGRERMEREETEGPPRELFQKKGKAKPSIKAAESDSEMSDDEEAGNGANGEDFDPSTLRKYQLERLRYYYAVVTTSSPETAKIIYDTMDGREYLASANFFDLRFIPDDVTFDDEPRDECTDVPVAYKPREFVTQALRHSKVQLAWDADDGTRMEVMRKAFDKDGEIDNDLMAYLGSDSSDEGEESDNDAARKGHRELLGMSDSDYSGDEDDDLRAQGSKSDRAATLRAALGLGGAAPSKEEKTSKPKTKKPAGNMEVTFTPALAPGKDSDDEGTKRGVFVNQPDTETTLEKYVRKERERKARRKQKMKGDDDENAETDDAPAAAPPASNSADLGFNDPFFDNPEKSAREEAKAAKKAKRAEKEREAEKIKTEKAREAQELELLMAGDTAAGGANIRHFDMKEVIKQQKNANKKGKGKKGKKGGDGDADAGPTDDFELNTGDSRFGALFDSHDFAIDPTNSRFMATKGMKKLMDERRKKRKVDDDDDVDGQASAGRAEKRDEKKPKKDDLLKLVDNIKRKSGKRS